MLLLVLLAQAVAILCLAGALVRHQRPAQPSPSTKIPVRQAPLEPTHPVTNGDVPPPRVRVPAIDAAAIRDRMLTSSRYRPMLEGLSPEQREAAVTRIAGLAAERLGSREPA